ncbi:MAG: sensor histidine kinase [Gaiellaceae bacterium]
MSTFRTVGARLSLALLVVVALVLGLVYLIVVPSLQTRLVDSRLNSLDRAARGLAKEYARNDRDPDFFSNASADTNARVILMSVGSQSPTLVTPGFSSLPGRNLGDYTNDPIATLTAQTSQRERGTVRRSDGEFAEVAAPIRNGSGDILLLSAPLHDALADVDAVQRRMVFAGVLALFVALAIGYGAARLFAERIRRLERAADRIASGRFDEPVTDSRSDELGELARAFDRMRVRLAGLDHARREFVANASHELRTPLFALGGFLELLVDEELDERTQREFLETMAGQVRRLTKLADDLLDLSRLDAGRLHVETQPVELDSVAGAAVEEFSGIARASDHPIEFARNGPAEALGDPQRVLQIARILLENALVHTPPGTAVEVTVRRVNGLAELSVVDAGPGISSEDRAELFERFYRGDSTKASGSGLGLAIAKQLAELMGGRIELDSEPGRTVFSLVLPAEKPAERAKS